MNEIPSDIEECDSATDPKFDRYKQKSKKQLKDKITQNVTIRCRKCVQMINIAVKQLFKANSKNNISKCCQSSYKPFATPNDLLKEALVILLQKVDCWVGVDLIACKRLPQSYKAYWQKADNWWNRYKAPWIGDHFFYPLLRTWLFEYVNDITSSYQTQLIYDSGSDVCNDMERTKYLIEYEKHTTQELIYFSVLKKILYTEMSFARARSQPLILDKAFVKSDFLRQFFVYLGEEHGLEWSLASKEQKRIVIRNYGKQWITKIFDIKQSNYSQIVMHIAHDSDTKEEESTKNEYVCDAYDSNYILPPMVQTMEPVIPITQVPNYNNSSNCNNSVYPLTAALSHESMDDNRTQSTATYISGGSPYLHSNSYLNCPQFPPLPPLPQVSQIPQIPQYPQYTQYPNYVQCAQYPQRQLSLQQNTRQVPISSYQGRQGQYIERTHRHALPNAFCENMNAYHNECQNGYAIDNSCQTVNMEEFDTNPYLNDRNLKMMMVTGISMDQAPMTHDQYPPFDESASMNMPYV